MHAICVSTFEVARVYEVSRDQHGYQKFGREAALDELTATELTEYEAELLLIEGHVLKELGRARRRLEAVRSAREHAA